MLGTTRLHSIFGAVSPGFNANSLPSINAMLSSFSKEGLSILFIAPYDKRPLDPRTENAKKKEQKEWEAEGNKGEKPAGYHLATNNAATLKKYAKELRKRYDGDNDNDFGLTPLNFGLVPDKSRLIVVDCDDTEENNAFKNFLMDHTENGQLRENLDITMPSVTSPGSVDQGTWEVSTPGQVYDDYGTLRYVPPTFVNRGGQISHANGGHWYFFYPEDYELPAGVKSKIPVTYDSRDRSPLLDRIRKAREWGMSSPNNPQALAEYNAAVEALNAVTREARDDYYNLEGKSPQIHERAKFVIMVHSCYVIIPPSSRQEGHYQNITGDLAWEPWLENTLASNISEYALKRELQEKQNRQAQEQAELTKTAAGVSPGATLVSSFDGFQIPAGISPSNSTDETARLNSLTPDFTPAPAPSEVDEDPYAAITSMSDESFHEAIERWAWTQAWEQILTPELGWVKQTPDKCGCPIFTAPGPHSSPKSATAHVGSCELGCSDSGRLHIWTDNPGEAFESYVSGGKRDFSKLSSLAILHYDGNVGKAMRAVGIEIPALRSADLDDLDFSRFLMNNADRLSAVAASATSLQDPVVLDPFDNVINEEPPKYFVVDTLETDSFSAIIGPPGSGKSFVAIDLAGCLVTGTPWLGKACLPSKVTYFAGEGRAGVIRRFRAWQEVRGSTEALLGKKLFIANYLPNFSMYTPAEFNKLADQIKETGSKVAIIDTWSRANAGADENSAEVTSATIATLNAMQRRCGCSIIVLHHTRKDSDSARGSSALNGAMDTEILVKKIDEDPDPDQNRRLISVEITKQKNAAPWNEPAYCQIVKHGEDEIEWRTIHPHDDPSLPVIEFPHTIQAPAAIADVNGIFEPIPNISVPAENSSAAFIFGTSYVLEDVHRRVREVPDIDVYNAILGVVKGHPGGISRAELVKYTVDEVRPNNGDVTISTLNRTRRQVTEALDSCTIFNMITLGPNKKYTKTRDSRYATPDEVLRKVKERDAE